MAVSGRNPGKKILFSCFSKVCISDLHALVLWGGYVLGFFLCCPFLRRPACDFQCCWVPDDTSLDLREIQHPGWEPCKINNRIWTSDCLLLGKEAHWYKDGHVDAALKFTDPSLSSQLPPQANREWGTAQSQRIWAGSRLLGELLAWRLGGWLQSCKHPASAVASWYLEPGPCVQ